MDELTGHRVDLGISPVVVGTMRFNMKSLSAADVQALIQGGISLQADTLHVSTEYDSFPLLQSALKSLPGSARSRLRYVVKLACPHFGEPGFSRKLLFDRVDEYLSALGADSLAVVQWMWRSESDDGLVRGQKFKESVGEIDAAMSQLVAAGKVGRFACFPYGADFMRVVRQSGLTQVQVDYANLLEMDLWEGGCSYPSIALRPYAAGRIFEPEQKSIIEDIAGELGFSAEETATELALKLLLCNSSVAGVVASVSTIAQLEACARIADGIEPNPAEFASLARLQSRLLSA